MAINGKKTVYFFKINFRQDEIVTLKSGEEVINYRYLTGEQILSVFDEIYYNEMSEIDTGNRAITVTMNSTETIIECVEKTKKYCVLKLGQRKAYNTVGVRNRETLDYRDVPINKDTEDLEMYTYCMVDFYTNVCAIISVHGAPTISSLKKMFLQHFHNIKPRVFVTADSIISADILQILSQKDIITQIKATVALPNNEMLSSYISPNRNVFDELQKLKSTEMTFKLCSSRNHNIFRNSSKISELFGTLSEQFGENLKKLDVRAKNTGEPSEVYDILNYKFTKSVRLSTDDTINDSSIISALKYTYNRSISEIQILLGDHNE